MEWDPGRTATDIFTFQGDSYTTTAGTQTSVPTTSFPFSETFDTNQIFHGSNLLARWRHVIDDERDWQIQTYYDFTQFNTGAGLDAIENRDTWDIDFQHRFPLTDAQRIVWGAGYRATSDHISYPPFPSAFTTPHQVVNIFSYFLQDEITLVPDRWTMTLGCKFLNNTYTNFEYQPSARLLYTIS
jgi:iron complex outermembrane receptor protein